MYELGARPWKGWSQRWLEEVVEEVVEAVLVEDVEGEVEAEEALLAVPDDASAAREWEPRDEAGWRRSVYIRRL